MSYCETRLLVIRTQNFTKPASAAARQPSNSHTKNIFRLGSAAPFLRRRRARRPPPRNTRRGSTTISDSHTVLFFRRNPVAPAALFSLYFLFSFSTDVAALQGQVARRRRPLAHRLGCYVTILVIHPRLRGKAPVPQSGLPSNSPTPQRRRRNFSFSFTANAPLKTAHSATCSPATPRAAISDSHTARLPHRTWATALLRTPPWGILSVAIQTRP